MHISYIPGCAVGNHLLTEEESKHCIRVLRMQTGDKLLVTDGKGFIYSAQILEPNPKKCIVQLTEGQKGYDHWPFELHIAIAPTKNIDRLEWFLEKATEIGIDAIHLFDSYHSERRKVNPERLEKVLVAAMKQSIKSRLPVLHDLIRFEKLLAKPFDGQKYIAWIDETIKDNLIDDYTADSNCLILIGSEGDFSKEEVQLAIKNGFKPISLGEARLRTETAALVACHTVQLINQMKRQ